MYKIIRFYSDPTKKNRTIKTGLTFQEALDFCSSSESSWKTCKKSHNLRRTKQFGRWFDGFQEE